MITSVTLVRNKAGILEAQCDAPTWRDGDQLIQDLKQKFKARVIHRAEGPDARTWLLSVEGKEFVVYQWDTGDLSFFAKDKQNEELMVRVASAVRAGLQSESA